MPREFSRKHRVAEELQRELGVLVTTQVKDPRVGLATITGVDVSPDLKHAKVYVGTLDLDAPAEQASQAIEGLRAARGFLKRELGKRLRLRTMPDLRFQEDATEREAHHLKQVIDRAVAEDRRHETDAHEAAKPEDDGSA